MNEIQLDSTYHTSQEDGEIRFSLYEHGCGRCHYGEVVVNNHEYNKYCVAIIESEYRIIPAGSTRSYDVDDGRGQRIKYEIYHMANMSIKDVINSVRDMISDDVMDLIREVDCFEDYD